MRQIINPAIEKNRICHPVGGWGEGNNGCFVFKDRGLNILISDGSGWEHVSVSRFDGKTPTWEQMCWVKETFWNEDEWVIQYHPAKADYLDYGRNVLHLWKPIGIELPKPEKIMV